MTVAQLKDLLSKLNPSAAVLFETPNGSVIDIGDAKTETLPATLEDSAEQVVMLSGGAG